MRKIIVSFVFLISLYTGFAQTNPFAKKFPLIDKYIDSLMKDWNIPGLALGVVYKDQLIYGKGYGYRDIDKKLPVTTTTIFPIASNTKLFTATAAAMLEEEGKLSLDKPAKTFMPSLNFFIDELNSKVTLRDMLSHRTGLPRYDGIWIASSATRKQAVEKVIHMKPQLGFREGYIYNNMMYAASGAVMESVAGMTWEEIIERKILHPLQMNATVFTDQEMVNTGNYALSYFELDSTRKLRVLSYGAQSHALGPAGTIKSNIEDMSHWMIAQLNGGKYKSVQAISDAAIKQTLVPNNISDKEGKWPELSNSLYALGRTIQTYKGYKISAHTGSIDGYYSNLTFVPSENLGIFIVENGEWAGTMRSVFSLPIIDRLLNLSRTNWSERYMKDHLKLRATQKRAKDSISATQVKNTVASHPLISFTGKYTNPIYGDVDIELQGNQLILAFKTQRAPLNHFHYDQFITNEETKGFPDFRLSFLTNTKGEIDRFNMRPFGEPLAEFVKKQ